MTATSVPPRILAVRFSSIGDILLTTPLLRALRRRHPGAHLAVLTKAAYRGLLAENPHLDAVLTLERDEPLRVLAARLRRERYTHLLDLHGNLRTRVLRLLVPGRWSGYPKHRIARAALIRAKRDLYRDRRPVAERYFDAARDLDVRPDGEPPELHPGASAQAAAAAWLAAERLGDARPMVALVPGAAHATKRWPTDYWTALAARLGEGGADVLVVGGPEDAPLADAVAAAAGERGRVAAGRFDLQGTGALLARAASVVAGDTGVAHMATAVGTPLVALYGPTVRAFGFFPYAAPGAARVLERPLDCRPCSSHGGPVCPLGHHRCLREIGAEEVLAALPLAVAGGRP